MFTFEDLGYLDPGGVQTLLSAADKDKLGTALMGASETLRDFFFSNMSERAAKIMMEDMQSMGTVRLKDADEAQMYMGATATEPAAWRSSERRVRKESVIRLRLRWAEEQYKKTI